jgi:hypothetical protein
VSDELNVNKQSGLARAVRVCFTKFTAASTIESSA